MLLVEDDLALVSVFPRRKRKGGGGSVAVASLSFGLGPFNEKLTECNWVISQIQAYVFSNSTSVQ